VTAIMMAPSAGRKGREHRTPADVQLDRLRRWLDGCPPEVPLMEAVHHAVLKFNRLDAGQVPWHRDGRRDRPRAGRGAAAQARP
jgi:hypothetical protein